MSIRRLVRSVKYGYAYLKLFTEGVNGSYWAGMIPPDDVGTLQEAKRLHASVYLSRGFINPGDIFGQIMPETIDPHQQHADYFVVKHFGEVVAVARQIVYKGEGPHHNSFPILQKANIHARSRRAIEKVPVNKIVEISALVKKRGESPIVPIILYRTLWRHSLSQHHKLWVMACDVRLYERLKLLFGPALTVTGKRTAYQGGDVIPAMLRPREGLLHMIRSSRMFMPFRRQMSRKVLRFFVSGCPDETLDMVDINTLRKMRISFEPNDSIGRLGWTWIGLITGYSLARSILVSATMHKYGVNPYAFMAIDVITAVIFSLAQVKSLRHFKRRNYRLASLWMIVVLIGFAMPYAYLFSFGAALPPYILTVILVWCGLFACVSIMSFVSKLRQRELSAAGGAT
jgi:hypothetical protein